MASRAGPRATGTDGSDYSHRETIANYYTASAELKVSLRKSLIPHMVLTACLVAKGAAVFLGSKYFLPLTSWEMLWLVSGVCAYIGFGGLAKNAKNRLIVYVVGNLFFGIIPLILGAMELVNQIMLDFKDIKKTPKTWKNSPAKMAIVAVCLSWQFAGIFHAIRLIRTWMSMGKKKKI